MLCSLYWEVLPTLGAWERCYVACCTWRCARRMVVLVRDNQLHTIRSARLGEPAEPCSVPGPVQQE